MTDPIFNRSRRYAHRYKSHVCVVKPNPGISSGTPADNPFHLWESRFAYTTQSCQFAMLAYKLNESQLQHAPSQLRAGSDTLSTLRIFPSLKIANQICTLIPSKAFFCIFVQRKQARWKEIAIFNLKTDQSVFFIFNISVVCKWILNFQLWFQFILLIYIFFT